MRTKQMRIEHEGNEYALITGKVASIETDATKSGNLISKVTVTGTKWDEELNAEVPGDEIIVSFFNKDATETAAAVDFVERLEKMNLEEGVTDVAILAFVKTNTKTYDDGNTKEFVNYYGNQIRKITDKTSLAFDLWSKEPKERKSVIISFLFPSKYSKVEYDPEKKKTSFSVSVPRWDRESKETFFVKRTMNAFENAGLDPVYIYGVAKKTPEEKQGARVCVVTQGVPYVTDKEKTAMVEKGRPFAVNQYENAIQFSLFI